MKNIQYQKFEENGHTVYHMQRIVGDRRRYAVVLYFSPHDMRERRLVALALWEARWELRDGVARSTPVYRPHTTPRCNAQFAEIGPNHNIRNLRSNW